MKLRIARKMGRRSQVYTLDQLARAERRLRKSGLRRNWRRNRHDVVGADYRAMHRVSVERGLAYIEAHL